jgi:UDP-glucose 4-epimerase
MEIKTALVTGGAGYLGSVLSKKLKREGWRVVCFDIKHPKHHYYDIYEQGDIRDRASLDYLFRQVKIDVVFHLAGRIEVGESKKYPTEFWEVNTGGTVTLLNAMKRNGIDYIVYSSTAGVYWAQKALLKEDSCVVDNHVYGSSKYAAENAIRDSGIKHVIFRYFNLAGADGDVGENHEPETHLIPSILQNLNSFQLYGNDFDTEDGTCVRDYVHVSDVATAHISAINYLLKGGNNELLNLGTGKGYSNMEIMFMITELFPVELKYDILPRRQGDPDQLVADITLAQKVLNYRPKHDIISILKSAYEWNEKTYEK